MSNKDPDEIQTGVIRILNDSMNRKYLTRQRIDKLLRDIFLQHPNIVSENQELHTYYLMGERNREKYRQEQEEVVIQRQKPTTFISRIKKIFKKWNN